MIDPAPSSPQFDRSRRPTLPARSVVLAPSPAESIWAEGAEAPSRWAQWWPRRRGHERRLTLGRSIPAFGAVLVLVALGSLVANPQWSGGQRPALSPAADAEILRPSRPVPGPPPSAPLAPSAPTTTLAGPAPDWTPNTIRVPRIGVDASIDPMGVDEKNVLQVPDEPMRVGWWSGGAQPGQIGPAVLVGHVDMNRGPAVFFRLRELKPGDEIQIDRADGTTDRFMVERLESHPKARFPTDEVYGDTPTSTLRLVTCFGAFDRSTHSYVDNLIVFANQVG